MLGKGSQGQCAIGLQVSFANPPTQPRIYGNCFVLEYPTVCPLTFCNVFRVVNEIHVLHHASTSRKFADDMLLFANSGPEVPQILDKFVKAVDSGTPCPRKVTHQDKPLFHTDCDCKAPVPSSFSHDPLNLLTIDLL